MSLSKTDLSSILEQLAGNYFPVNLKVIQPVYQYGKSNIPDGFSYFVELPANPYRFLRVYIPGECQIDENALYQYGKLRVAFNNPHYILATNSYGSADIRFFADSIIILPD